MPKFLMCSEQNLEKDLSGNVYIVTGTTSGIGLETVKQLAKQSATIVCASRNVELSNKISEDLATKYSKSKVHVMHLELGSLASIKQFVENFLNKFSKLDGLVNNAAVMNTSQQTTEDGFELQFGVNFLGHFLLTELLTPCLRETKQSRIVHTSSVFHERGTVDITDLNFSKRKYSGWEAYYQSKLAQVLYARHQAKLTKGSNISVVSIHPGWAQTPLIKHTLPVFFQNVLLKPVLILGGMVSPKLGCQTTLHCLLDAIILEHSGCFFSQVGIYKDKESRSGGWPMKSPNSQVYNDSLCEELYNEASKLVGLNQEA
tara:strand:- start:354 stop:1301 length:948 start_codon:yes stop_codon:yes gene_type:complete